MQDKFYLRIKLLYTRNKKQQEQINPTVNCNSRNTTKQQQQQKTFEVKEETQIIEWKTPQIFCMHIWIFH
jgi:hypothetical protein